MIPRLVQAAIAGRLDVARNRSALWGCLFAETKHHIVDEALTRPLPSGRALP
jgi:hypothetical protein